MRVGKGKGYNCAYAANAISESMHTCMMQTFRGGVSSSCNSCESLTEQSLIELRKLHYSNNPKCTLNVYLWPWQLCCVCLQTLEQSSSHTLILIGFWDKDWECWSHNRMQKRFVCSKSGRHRPQRVLEVRTPNGETRLCASDSDSDLLVLPMCCCDRVEFFPPLHWTTVKLYDDCLEDKRENYQNCSVLCCVTQLCTIICTLIWAVLTVELVLFLGFVCFVFLLRPVYLC